MEGEWRQIMNDIRELYRTGPDAPSGRYMRTFWHPVAIAENLKPGWATPIKILSENFTLYRGEEGTAHILAFQCAHRGMQLSAGWVEGDCLRCRYHGWKYDGSGQCVEVPTESESVAKTIRIQGYPTREYLGLVFAYLGEGEPPPFPRYPDFEEGLLWAEAYMRPCNFFNNLENDPVHIPFAHRESEIFRHRPVEIPLKVEAEESEWGITLNTTFPQGRVHISQHGWPNIISFKAPDRNHLAWRVPIDDEHHWSFQIDIMHATKGEEGEIYRRRHAAREGKVGRSYDELAEAVLRGKLRIQDIQGDDAANMIWIQDYVTQVGQGRFADRKSERLIASDTGVLLQRKLWEREVKACVEGRPLKSWARTERIIHSYRHQEERSV